MADGTINLAEATERRGEAVLDSQTRRADAYSVAWARVVKPISFSLLALVFLTMMLPFVLISTMGADRLSIAAPAGESPEQVAAAVRAAAETVASEQLKTVLDWAKTILAPVVGFISAMVGYYFGTRSAEATIQGKPTAD